MTSGVIGASALDVDVHERNDVGSAGPGAAKGHTVIKRFSFSADGKWLLTLGPGTAAVHQIQAETHSVVRFDLVIEGMSISEAVKLDEDSWAFSPDGR
jgi:hypothetical protein